MNSRGYTIIELMIAAMFIFIGAALIYTAATGGASLPNKQSCIAAGGKWSEGIQYGRITQLCTYN